METMHATSVVNLIREELRSFAGYRSARNETFARELSSCAIWLNANESPWPNQVDTEGALRRYPEPQPTSLLERLADLYAVDRQQVLIGRGSDEAIDLLVRVFCRAHQDGVVIVPPTFGMYAVCAKIQGAEIHEAPARACDDRWVTNFDQLRDFAVAKTAKIVFLCSPGNPTGELLPLTAIRELALALSGRCLVVVDEAYLEYADAASASSLIEECDNVAVLRTLSKAHALAGARVGCLIAHPDVIAILRRCQAPYPVPAPSADLALHALDDDCVKLMKQRVAMIRCERERVSDCLRGISSVKSVFASNSNFLLVRFWRAGEVYLRLLESGVVVRDLRAFPGLDDALRITIGSVAENNAMLAVLSDLAAVA